MKKASAVIMVAITCIFIGFVAGTFFGKNYGKEPIRLSTLPTEASATDVSRNTVSDAALSEDTMAETEPAENTAAEWRVNINTGTLEELDLIPGVGPVIAQRIIDYRTENGPFTDVSELTNVKGIGDTTLEKMLDYIIVEDSQ